MAAVFASFRRKPSEEDIKRAWAEFSGPAQELGLPSAPKQFIHYFEQADRPSNEVGPRDRKRHGRLRAVCAPIRSMTISLCVFFAQYARGAAGGAVLLAELLAAKRAILPECLFPRASRKAGDILKQPVFRGCGTALVTPMYPDGRVNYSMLRQLIEYQIENGADALVLWGLPARPPSLDDKEHLLVFAFAHEAIAGRVPFIAGTGSNDTRHAIAMSLEAKQCGADALLLVTPLL